MKLKKNFGYISAGISTRENIWGRCTGKDRSITPKHAWTPQEKRKLVVSHGSGKRGDGSEWAEGRRKERSGDGGTFLQQQVTSSGAASRTRRFTRLCPISSALFTSESFFRWVAGLYGVWPRKTTTWQLNPDPCNEVAPCSVDDVVMWMM